MARVKRAVHSKKHRRATLERAKGYYGNKSRSYRAANEQVMHSLQYAFRDRRARKGEFRKLWIARINAAAREIPADNILVATGRRARTAGLGLDRLDLTMNGACVAIDERCATSMLNVWAVGDLGAVYQWQSATQSFTEISHGFYGDVRDLAAWLLRQAETGSTGACSGHRAGRRGAHASTPGSGQAVKVGPGQEGGQGRRRAGCPQGTAQEAGAQRRLTCAGAWRTERRQSGRRGTDRPPSRAMAATTSSWSCRCGRPEIVTVPRRRPATPNGTAPPWGA